MRKQVVLCLKVAWTVAALMILFVGASVCTANDSACEAAGNAMALFMVLLTFPTGIIFLPIALAFDDSFRGHFPSDFIVQWSVLAIGGFVQWFYLMPRLLEKPTLTLLGLKSEPALSSAATASPSTPLNLGTSAPPRLASTSPPPIRIRTRKAQNQVRSFDKLGRSPLERVLNR